MPSTPPSPRHMVQDDGLVFYNMVSSSDKLGCHIWVYVSTATRKLNMPRPERIQMYRPW